MQVLPLPLLVGCWSRARTLERIHLQPAPANEFPAQDPMPVSLSRPVRLRAKELTDTAGLASGENPALFCMLLSARVAVMLPYNVERIPVQRAWETLGAVHLQALGIDPENVFPLQRSRPPTFMPHPIRFAFLFGAK